MRQTAIPAQVTTVEDRIFGNLGMSQVLFVLIAIVSSATIFMIAPPASEAANYKYILVGIISTACGILAIRVKGKIIALWAVIMLTYYLRPKYYLYDKNVATLRETYQLKKIKQPEEEETDKEDESRPARPELDIATTAQVLATIDNPAAKVRFETGKKGNLYVRLTEVEK